MGKDNAGGGVTVPRTELEKTENKGSCHISAYGVVRQLGCSSVRRGTGKGASAICIARECLHLQLDVRTIAHM